MPEITLRQHCDQRLLAMENNRLSWWQHWRELADFILPRRYRWLVTPNEMNRGLQINGRIVDSTGTLASRVLAAGMMAGITSPTRPWFKLRLEGVDIEEDTPITAWLFECERRMMRVFQESNFYNSLAVLYHDLVVFGTGAQLIYEDFDNVICCYNPCAGEYYLDNSPKMKIEVFARKFTRTVAQTVEEFGYENCSITIKQMYDRGGSDMQQETILAHMIEPNLQGFERVPASFPYREAYWEWGSTNGTMQTQPQDGPPFLRTRGFNELPGIFPRWDITGNDPYGRSPGMDALGDIKQLQQETRRKAQAIDKLVNPPMVADVQLKNQPASLLPGGVTYISGLSKTTEGMRPIYQVNPQIQEMSQDILTIQNRIKHTFYNDLFMMFQQMEAEPRSAAAIDARREEKLIMLGPVLERFQHEALDPAIDRVFNIMQRADLLPPAPREIQGRPLQVVYSSILAEAQRAAATIGIERTVAFAGNVVAVAPDALDNIDIDESIRIYASNMAGDPRIIRDKDAVIAMRVERQEKEQQIQQLAVTDAAAKGAKTLSETDVGGGQNALEALVG